MIGRTVPSWAADFVGRYNISIAFSFMSSFVVWAFWIPLHNSNAGVITFAVFYGIFSGAVIALTPALVAQIRYVVEAYRVSPEQQHVSCVFASLTICYSDVDEIGMRTGTLYGLLGLVTLSSTLSAGGIVDATHGEFLGLKIFCGASIAVGLFFLTWARVSLAGWKPKAIA